MKKFSFLFIILIFLGCAALKQAKTDAMACLQDPVCRQEAVNQAQTAKSIAVDFAGISPIPMSANVAGAAAYGIFFLIALIKGGREKHTGA